jgi:predicted PurR-regulated permease PerM
MDGPCDNASPVEGEPASRQRRGSGVPPRDRVDTRDDDAGGRHGYAPVRAATSAGGLMNDAGPTRTSRSAAEWAAVRARIRMITPQALARAGLTAAVAAGVVAGTIATWPALLPFALGGLIAYTLVPVVDALSRVMPRPVAAVVSMAGVVVGVVAILALVVPPLTAGFVRLALELPTSDDVRASIASLEGRVGGLPEGSDTVVIPVAQSLARVVNDALSSMPASLDGAVRSLVQGVVTATATVLGLIVLPTWMLGLMTQKDRLRHAVDARVPGPVRADAWAVARIADRAAGSYLRGYVVAAALVGALAYLGAQLSPRVGGPEFGQPLALATFAGATQLVPVVGPLLGFVPGLLLVVVDPNRAAAYTVVYVAARVLGSAIIGSRIQGRRLGVHPLILVPSVIALGQLGPLWLLLSAPIVAFTTDVVRYAHGRLSEPARPAGVLPGTPAEASRRPAEAAGHAAAYRRPVAPTAVARQ